MTASDNAGSAPKSPGGTIAFLRNGGGALLFVASIVAGMAAAKAILKIYDTDEFHTFYGATLAHALDDMPNNPPLFNLIAAMLQGLIPAPAVFLLPFVFALLAAVTSVRLGIQAGLSPYILAGVLGCFARGWMDLAAYYRAFSMVSLFLLLAFHAWRQNNARQFFAFTTLASLSHHLGWFGGASLLGLSWLLGPRLPWWTVLALLPDAGIIAWGSLGKLAERATWGMSTLAVARAPVWQIAPAAYLCLAKGVTAASRKIAAWTLGLYVVLVFLSSLIPFREQYLWIIIPSSTLVWAVWLQQVMGRVSARRRRLASFLIVLVAIAGIIRAALHLGTQLVDREHMQSLENTIRSHAQAGSRLFFYPDSDLLFVHYALSGFGPVQDYSINMQYEVLGPLVREAAMPQPPGPVGTPGIQRFRSAGGMVLDIAPLRVPFVVDTGYDALVLRQDYGDLAQVPSEYVQVYSAGLFLLFSRRTPSP